jgi:hypothetical protein
VSSALLPLWLQEAPRQRRRHRERVEISPASETDPSDGGLESEAGLIERLRREAEIEVAEAMRLEAGLKEVNYGSAPYAPSAAAQRRPYAIDDYGDTASASEFCGRHGGIAFAPDGVSSDRNSVHGSRMLADPYSAAAARYASHHLDGSAAGARRGCRDPRHSKATPYNLGNVRPERSSTRRLAPPGGVSTLRLY